MMYFLMYEPKCLEGKLPSGEYSLPNLISLSCLLQKSPFILMLILLLGPERIYCHC